MMRTIGKLVLAATAAACVTLGCGRAHEDAHKEHEEAPAAETLKIEQKTCPIMEGNKINPKLFVDHKSRRIYFCCKMCVKTFKENPEKYVKKVDEEIAKSKTTE